MMNAMNIIKATLICALVNTVYTFYVSTSVFVKQLAFEGQTMGRIEAFINTAEITENFWRHMIKGWSYSFGISLISCLFLLLWLSLKTPNKALVRDAGEKPPAPHS